MEPDRTVRRGAVLTIRWRGRSAAWLLPFSHQDNRLGEFVQPVPARCERRSTSLVLGPAIDGGATVRGVVVGLMYMEDEKGLDSKVVLSSPAPDGRPAYDFTTSEQQRIADYFRRYKKHEGGAFSQVPGWGSVAEGTGLVMRTHVFFLKCRDRAGETCRGVQ